MLRAWGGGFRTLRGTPPPHVPRVRDIRVRAGWTWPSGDGPGIIFGRQRAKFDGPAKLVGLRASPPRSAKLVALGNRLQGKPGTEKPSLVFINAEKEGCTPTF